MFPLAWTSFERSFFCDTVQVSLSPPLYNALGTFGLSQTFNSNVRRKLYKLTTHHNTPPSRPNRPTTRQNTTSFQQFILRFSEATFFRVRDIRPTVILLTHVSRG